MAGTENQNGKWKKALLALFLLLAIAGIIIGAIAGTMPDKFGGNKDKSSVAPNDVSKTATPQGADEVIPVPQEPVKQQAPATNVPPATQTIVTPPATTTTTTPLMPITNIGKPSDSTVTAPVNGGNVISGAVNQVLSGALSTSNGTVPLPEGVSGKQAAALVNNVVSGELQNAISASGACLVTTGPEFVTAMTGTSCTLITLVPGATYDTGEDQIEVTGRKVVVGNPLNLPTLDGQNTPRIFRVMPGGYLDLRYVRTYRGGGELIATIPVLRGGSVLVELGGTGSFLGCIFTNAPPDAPAVFLAPNLSRAVRVFGGQIYVAGGVVTVTLCHFWVMQPGVVLREVHIFGAEILIGAGVLVVTGSTFTNTQLFLNVIGSAAFIAQLGGALICSGVAFTLNTGVLHASGAGMLNFLGGGVSIFSGCSYSVNLGTLAHFGAGILVFNGGGVMVTSGSGQSVEVGAAIACGAGTLQSQGGGVAVYSGVGQSLLAGALFVASAGILNWMGGGSWTSTGFAISRSIGVSSVYGIGGSMASGGGSMVAVGCPSADNLAVTSVAIAGGDLYLGTGVLIDVGNPYFKSVGVGLLAMYGIHSFVGAGGAADFGSPAFLQLGAVFVTPTPPVINVVNGVPHGNGGWFTRRALLGNGNNNASASEVVEGLGDAPLATYTMLKQTNISFNNPQASGLVKALSALSPKLDISQVQVNGNTACNICGDKASATITGERAGQCTNDQSKCTIETAPTPDGSPMPKWISQVVNSGPSKLIDTTVLSSVVKVGCDSALAGVSISSCVDKDVVKDVIADGLADDCAQVQVSSRALPAVPELDLMDSSVQDALPDSAVTSVFDVMFSTHDAACAAKVHDYITAQGADKAGVVETFNGLSSDKVVINDASMAFVTTHVAKGMDFKTANKNVLSNTMGIRSMSLTPTVLVTAESRLAQPTFQSSDTATVALSNFIRGKDIKLALTSDCTLSTPLGSGNTKNAALVYSGKFEDTGVGGNQMLIDVPLANAPIPADKPSAQLAMMAEQNGVRWCSQPIIVTK